ncbi:hypothetical protein Cgig2_028749 [Carnegiea gigantea]|uniref:Bifunctional inhibitor/plant lipid transfer protein/seed storage helical domain-containing protein n=1 Tax=Carnegiea gigantea TaxID=171969 RepID=A0A9Q1GV68_9CARY|nr:hypothetical protein Cgig2_028749 [Carnegiea gigantea]
MIVITSQFKDEVGKTQFKLVTMDTTVKTTKLMATTLIFALLVLSTTRNAYRDCPATPSCAIPASPPPIPRIPPLTTPAPLATPSEPSCPPARDPGMSHCPRHVLKFGVCADIPGLVHAIIGNPPSGTKCCAVFRGMAKMEMAMCLCIAIKAKVLGINLNVPVVCTVILSASRCCQLLVADNITKKLMVMVNPPMFSIFMVFSFVGVVYSDCPLPATPMNCSELIPPPLSSNNPPSPKPEPALTSCPRDVLKFGTCLDIPGLVRMVMGAPPSGIPCCAMLGGMARMEMAICLCTAIKANILGVYLNVPIAYSVVLSACQQTTPPGFKCEMD